VVLLGGVRVVVDLQPARGVGRGRGGGWQGASRRTDAAGGSHLGAMAAPQSIGQRMPRSGSAAVRPPRSSSGHARPCKAAGPGGHARCVHPHHVEGPDDDSRQRQRRVLPCGLLRQVLLQHHPHALAQQHHLMLPASRRAGPAREPRSLDAPNAAACPRPPSPVATTAAHQATAARSKVSEQAQALAAGHLCAPPCGSRGGAPWLQGAARPPGAPLPPGRRPPPAPARRLCRRAPARRRWWGGPGARPQTWPGASPGRSSAWRQTRPQAACSSSGRRRRFTSPSTRASTLQLGAGSAWPCAAAADSPGVCYQDCRVAALPPMHAVGQAPCPWPRQGAGL
jgi:hypothetical protein